MLPDAAPMLLAMTRSASGEWRCRVLRLRTKTATTTAAGSVKAAPLSGPPAHGHNRCQIVGELGPEGPLELLRS
jgi:hypothetical protein